MEFRTIRQTSHIDGSNRNPGAGEHDKAMIWDNNAQKVKYVLINGLSANSKTVDGYVVKGDDSSAANYIWKLDATKNPAWRLEEYLSSIAKVGNSAIFTMNSGGTKELALGALAWQDSITGAVTSVFGRSGDVLALSGDYTAAKVTNAFDKLNNTLDDVLEGDSNKHFTAAYKADVDANTLARHTHTNKVELDLIVDAGDGVIPTSSQIYEWDNYTTADAQNVMDTVAGFIQDGLGITWDYDDTLDTLTPTVSLNDFTTDDLAEGVVNKYFGSSNITVQTITLPSQSTVAARIAAAVAGTDYPSDWTLTASGIDLIITHNLGKRIANVTIFSDNLNIERQLFGNAAYSGIYQDHTIGFNSVVIESLATIETDITIELIFSGNSISVGAPTAVLATVETYTPSNITTTSFDTGGTVTDDGNSTVTERGIVYALTSNPTVLDNKFISGDGVGFFLCNITDLAPGTRYYYRSFATNSIGTAYGMSIYFKTHSS